MLVARASRFRMRWMRSYSFRALPGTGAPGTSKTPPRTSEGPPGNIRVVLTLWVFRDCRHSRHFQQMLRRPTPGPLRRPAKLRVKSSAFLMLSTVFELLLAS